MRIADTYIGLRGQQRVVVVDDSGRVHHLDVDRPEGQVPIWLDQNDLEVLDIVLDAGEKALRGGGSDDFKKVFNDARIKLRVDENIG